MGKLSHIIAERKGESVLNALLNNFVNVAVEGGWVNFSHGLRAVISCAHIEMVIVSSLWNQCAYVCYHETGAAG